MQATTPKVRALGGRTGSASVLIVTMMFVFIVTAAFTVDYAYMQLVRTELRSATDAAAKAGAEALSRTQDANAARFEAIRYAAANSVGGRPFRLNNNDITIGRVSSNANGKWNFQAGGSPPNAVRVNSRTGNGYANEAVPLYFSGVLGKAALHASMPVHRRTTRCRSLLVPGPFRFDELRYVRRGLLVPIRQSSPVQLHRLGLGLAQHVIASSPFAKPLGRAHPRCRRVLRPSRTQ